MEKILLITEALDMIESNLTEDINTEVIAKRLFCSKSSIEKLFRFVTNMSIKDYTIRRRMSKAAKDLANDDGNSLLDIAMKYGYGSNEAFTRAFKGVWHTTPSEYRKNPRRYELFPALRLESELMEDESMRGKHKVDISELYDYIRDHKDCYFIGADIKNLMAMNDISFETGDIAILTALNRIEKAIADDEIVFRVGGDEFVAITSSQDKDYSEKVVAEILSHNGETITCGGQEIPLELYASSYKIEANVIRYAELFTTIQKEIDRKK